MRVTTISLLALCYYVGEVLGFENKFIFPTDDDLTFDYMNTIEVQYQSNFTNPTLYTWCIKGNAGKINQKDKTSAPKNNGTVSVTLDFTTADLCWFNLKEDPSVEGVSGFNGVEWAFEAGKKNTTTVKNPEPSSTTSTSSTTSATPSSSITATTPATTTTAAATAASETGTSTATPSVATENNADTARSIGVKVGIGIGAAVGGLLAMTVIGMVASRIVRRKQAAANLEYAASSWPAPSFVESHKPMSAVSYNPVSQFEPSGRGEYQRYS